MLTVYRLPSLAYRVSMVELGGCGEYPQLGLFLPAASGLGGTKWKSQKLCFSGIELLRQLFGSYRIII